MSDLRIAAQQALEAMLNFPDDISDDIFKSITALKAALAQQPEPVAYIHRQGRHWEASERPLTDDEKARGWTEEPLYTAPPQRPPLTDEEIDRLWRDPQQGYWDYRKFARATERKVRGEKE